MKVTVTSALLAVTLSVVASGCGSAASSSSGDPTPAPPGSGSTAAVARPTALVDEIVAIDQGRMHLRCVGSGATTVLLIAGWGDGGEHWGAVEPSIGEHARVCSYARFGTGTSDPPPSTQTFDTQATDLHALLDAADEPGPYVVVGHSFGGAEAVTFASKYPDETTGLVLVDASPATWPATVCSVAAYAPLCAVMHDPTLDPERLDAVGAFQAVEAITSLGDLPMAVVTAAHRDDPSLPPAELARLDAAWAAGVEQWATLSPESTVVVVEDTGHHIEVDQPAVVIDQVLALLPEGGRG
jgi:pimeloyl-ACP methyl ester carboxylesterase